MTTRTPKALVIPTPRLVTDALALAGRFRDAEGLRRHVLVRKPLLQGAAAVLVLLGLACGAGVFLFLAGLRTWLTLPGVLLAPLVALGSLFVLFYVFFAWIEARALALALRQHPRRGSIGAWVARKLRAELGAMPAVPWLAAALFVGLPFALLAAAAPAAAVVLALVAAATPLAYAHLDARLTPR